jgi:hypothetical protein
METGYIFSALVFAIAAFHVIWKLVEHTTRLFKTSGLRSGSGKAATRRDDWYMFFHRSDLTGQNDENRPAKRTGTAARTPGRKDTRPAARQYLS